MHDDDKQHDMNKEGRVLTSDDDDYHLYRATSNITKKPKTKKGRESTHDK